MSSAMEIWWVSQKKTYNTRNNEKEQVRESLIKSSPKDYKNSKSHNVS